jgi:hypothetical protein
VPVVYCHLKLLGLDGAGSVTGSASSCTGVKTGGYVELILPLPTTLLVNANVVVPLLSASYVPVFSMYTLLAVPIEYVFPSNVTFEVDPDSKPLNVNLLYVSKSRDGPKK